MGWWEMESRRFRKIRRGAGWRTPLELVKAQLLSGQEVSPNGKGGYRVRVSIPEMRQWWNARWRLGIKDQAMPLWIHERNGSNS